MVDSGFAVGRGAGFASLAVAATIVGIGLLVCINAAIYGYESFKDDIRTEERAYLLVRGASEVVRVLVEHGARRGLSSWIWEHGRAYGLPLE